MLFSFTKLFFCKTGLLRNFYAHDAFDDLPNGVDEKCGRFYKSNIYPMYISILIGVRFSDHNNFLLKIHNTVATITTF